MTYSLSPSLLPATDEKVNVNQIVYVTQEGFDPPITSVTVIKGDNTSGNINVNVSTSSFTVIGQYYDNWNKTIWYEEFVKSGNTFSNILINANKWSNISANLNFVANYAFSEAFSPKTATFYVIVNNTANITLSQTINSNYTPDAQHLVEQVARGKV